MRDRDSRGAVWPPEIREQAMRMCREGCSIAHVSRVLGVPESTVGGWYGSRSVPSREVSLAEAPWERRKRLRGHLTVVET